MSEKMTAIERLEGLLDEKDEELRELREQIRDLEARLEGVRDGWTIHVDLPKEQTLPVPRLELVFEPTGSEPAPWQSWVIYYRLVYRQGRLLPYRPARMGPPDPLRMGADRARGEGEAACPSRQEAGWPRSPRGEAPADRGGHRQEHPPDGEGCIVMLSGGGSADPNSTARSILAERK